MGKLKLEIELIPKSSWGISLANLLEKDEWDKLRREAYKRAGHTCEICETTGVRVNAHEVWKFEEKKKIQRLSNIICLCDDCHDCIHYGRSEKVYGPSKLKALREHWCRVNGLPEAAFLSHKASAFELWKKRSKIFFTVKVGRKVLG